MAHVLLTKQHDKLAKKQNKKEQMDTTNPNTGSEVGYTTTDPTAHHQEAMVMFWLLRHSQVVHLSILSMLALL